MAIELRLVIHSHNPRNQRSGNKHTFAHHRQMEEFAIIEGQLGISKLVSCRRASNCDFVDVFRPGVLPIGCRPHSCRSQVFALIMSMYSAVCTLKTRRVRRVRPNFRQGNRLQRAVTVTSTANQFRHGRCLSRFIAKGDSKGAIHAYIGEVVGVNRRVWLIASLIEMHVWLV